MKPKTFLAMEVPTAHLDEVSPLIDWHFCIATEALKDQKYFNWYINRPVDSLVMLDNGMFEEGKPLSPKELLDVALEIKPQVVFAPDQVGNMRTTLDMSMEFTRMAREAGLQSTIAYIPQGNCPEEVALCFWSMWRLFSGNFYGISFLNDRNKVMELIPQVDNYWNEMPPAWLHFLGMYNIDERKDWTVIPHSIDTIKPLKAAYHGLAVEDAPRGLGKWNTHMVVEESNKALLYRNIAYAHAALGVV